MEPEPVLQEVLVQERQGEQDGKTEPHHHRPGFQGTEEKDQGQDQVHVQAMHRIDPRQEEQEERDDEEEAPDTLRLQVPMQDHIDGHDEKHQQPDIRPEIIRTSIPDYTQGRQEDEQVLTQCLVVPVPFTQEKSSHGSYQRPEQENTHPEQVLPAVAKIVIGKNDQHQDVHDPPDRRRDHIGLHPLSGSLYCYKEP